MDTSMLNVNGQKTGISSEFDINNDDGNASLKFNMGIIDGLSANYPPVGLTS
jgi:hypothetical protein